MPRCFGQAKIPFTYGDTVAVAIDRDRGHLGVFHTSGGKQVRQLHLARHNDLRSESLDESDFSCWIRPEISEELAFSVSAFCRLFTVAHANRRVPYGFSLPKGALSRTGHLMPDVIGLTCASLVLALFDRSAPLLDYDTWPIRADDVDWQNDIAQRFLARRLTPEEFEKLLSEVPSVRFKPIEVATAAYADTLPQTYAGVQALRPAFAEAASISEHR